MFRTACRRPPSVYRPVGTGRRRLQTWLSGSSYLRTEGVASPSDRPPARRGVFSNERGGRAGRPSEWIPAPVDTTLPLRHRIEIGHAAPDHKSAGFRRWRSAGDQRPSERLSVRTAGCCRHVYCLSPPELPVPGSLSAGGRAVQVFGTKSLLNYAHHRSYCKIDKFY